MIWYKNTCGVGIDMKHAVSADTVKLSKKQRLNLIEIEPLEPETNNKFIVAFSKNKFAS